MAPIKRISCDKISRVCISDIEIGTVRAFIVPRELFEAGRKTTYRENSTGSPGTSLERALAVVSVAGRSIASRRIIDETASISRDSTRNCDIGMPTALEEYAE